MGMRKGTGRNVKRVTREGAIRGYELYILAYGHMHRTYVYPSITPLIKLTHLAPLLIYPTRLYTALVLTANLPDQKTLDRWLGEPIR